MHIFAQQLFEGISTGAIYASLGLAICLIYRSTKIANFAQGEMAMFSTYLAWQMIAWGVPIWAALVITLAVSFALGAAIERILMRPVEQADHLTVIIVTFGISLIVYNLAGFFWGYVTKPFPPMFSERIAGIGDVRLSFQSIGTVAVLVAEVALLYLFLQHTKLGLAIRAVASNPASSELVGISVHRVYMLGWGLAATLGALSGMLVAPRILLDPTMMGSVLISAFAGLALGVAIPCNISRKAEVEALVAGSRARYGAIDILVCNAAVNPSYGPMDALSDQAFDKIMSANVKSTLWLAGLVLPEMADRGGGVMIIMSSIAGLRGTEMVGGYGLSKAADLALARNLAVEWGPRNVRVNCIAPGLVRTDFARALWEDRQGLDRLLARTPLGRIGRAEEIGGIAAFLASPAASFITGQAIVADGGVLIA